MKNSGNYRVTHVSRNGSRHVSLMNEMQLQRYRARRLQTIRKKDLGLTQKAFAEAVGANVRTLQDWETGRFPMPKPVEILMQIMREFPPIRKRLLDSVSVNAPKKRRAA
jgi:DNA-binding transcriptional regulator YiaG